MGSEHRFTLVLFGWIALLLAALAAAVWAFSQPGLAVVRLVALGTAAGSVAGLVGQVRRTNLLLARFVEALRHGDFSASFDAGGGAGFDRLGNALTGAMRDLRAERAKGLEAQRFLEVLLDDLPVALLTVDTVHGVQLRNKAARRLLTRDVGTRPEDYRVYGEAFAQRMLGSGGLNEVLELEVGGVSQRCLVRTGLAERPGLPVRIVTIEPMQGTLDTAEMGMQTDLVRVLAHEMLNSLTPVTSLAGSAVVLLGEENPNIAEARAAVLTLARRSEGLRRFIESYRAVAHPLDPRVRSFAAAPFAAELERLFKADWIEHRLTVSVDPSLILHADPDLLAQAMLNLLRNAAQAGSSNVRLSFEQHGGAVLITVEDDGAGVPEAIRNDVFLPFFTTRRGGSGIGLNLVRQIVVAHGWTISLAHSPLGGAQFRIVAHRGSSNPARAPD
ncbi:HAMP domain-containing histidine kinase [Sphingomonas sp. MG17]|uniref:histidine kinase n=1 Tax=Sphingomonas tagetis TaxID=2949092 RepID=A0A9X2HQB4_9SPHN|nr:HAMP domain-containing sensor histidine kinase [Sphingomonas tagetis]MCP3732471.1 HAMP domain-containing histidine kinase [Sphingomonas tagetis]